MHTIDHEHIVRLYGVVLDTNSLMLVSFTSAVSISSVRSRNLININILFR